MGSHKFVERGLLEAISCFYLYSDSVEYQHGKS